MIHRASCPGDRLIVARKVEDVQGEGLAKRWIHIALATFQTGRRIGPNPAGYGITLFSGPIDCGSIKMERPLHVQVFSLDQSQSCDVNQGIEDCMIERINNQGQDSGSATSRACQNILARSRLEEPLRCDRRLGDSADVGEPEADQHE